MLNLIQTKPIISERIHTVIKNCTKIQTNCFHIREDLHVEIYHSLHHELQPGLHCPPALSHHVDTGETLLERGRRLRLGTTKKGPG